MDNTSKFGFLKSRKFWIIVFSMSLLLAAYIIAGKIVILGALYTTIVGGIMGLAGMYMGANVTHRHISGLADARLQGPGEDEGSPSPTTTQPPAPVAPEHING